MIIALASLLSIGVIAFLLVVRPKDLPVPQPVSPTAHLEERKAAIYENLRDLQFEYRVGKMSDDDYQRSKVDLQKELANVMAEMERITSPSAATAPAPKKRASNVCPHCNAEFPQPLKFCGECGKSMKAPA